MTALNDDRQLPPGTEIAGYQTWGQLAFLHWRVSPEVLQPLLPASLIVEQFDGSAWIGVVPFAMKKVRPWWSPPVPGISWFLETNVRTYVRDAGGVSGVWFFSLEANSRLAVALARTFWNLPYFNCRMELHDSAAGQRAVEGANHRTVTYQGHRPKQPSCRYQLELAMDDQQPEVVAAADTLEHFLLERYVLFTADPGNGEIYCGSVHHGPYRFRSAHPLRCQQTLCETAGIPLSAESTPDHVVFSSGVDVVVSPLKLCF